MPEPEVVLDGADANGKVMVAAAGGALINKSNVANVDGQISADVEADGAMIKKTSVVSGDASRNVSGPIIQKEGVAGASGAATGLDGPDIRKADNAATVKSGAASGVIDGATKSQAAERAEAPRTMHRDPSVMMDDVDMESGGDDGEVKHDQK